MPAPPKVFIHGGLYFISAAAEEGFMFPPNELTEEIMKKSIAQAQKLYPIIILDLIIQPTHVHMLVMVLDPSDAADFMERFKTESAHAINRVLGRKRKTVWCERYDSPLIPDLATAMDKIVYIYANPSNDSAVDSIDTFPGLHTFRFRQRMAESETASLGERRIETYILSRPDFPALSDHSVEEYRRYRWRLIRNKQRSSFTVDPNALFRKFGITDDEEIRRLNAVIVAGVRLREEHNRKLREAEGRTVIGFHRLRTTPIGAPYTPHRTGRRMRVHCKDKKLRRYVLSRIRELVTRRKMVRDLRRRGDFSVPYPFGLFIPADIRLAEPLGW